MKAPPGVEFRRCAKIAQFYFRQQKNDVRQQKTNIGQKEFAKTLLRRYISRTKPKNRNAMEQLEIRMKKINGYTYLSISEIDHILLWDLSLANNEKVREYILLLRERFNNLNK